MRISDWSSDVCSSDLFGQRRRGQPTEHVDQRDTYLVRCPGDLRIEMIADRLMDAVFDRNEHEIAGMIADTAIDRDFLQSLRGTEIANLAEEGRAAIRSEEHKSELQSLMRHSYTVFV